MVLSCTRHPLQIAVNQDHRSCRVGGTGGDLRSKTRVLNTKPRSIHELPISHFDGSFTHQVSSPPYISSWPCRTFARRCLLSSNINCRLKLTSGPPCRPTSSVPQSTYSPGSWFLVRPHLYPRSGCPATLAAVTQNTHACICTARTCIHTADTAADVCFLTGTVDRLTSN
jgi:hypothetical protein